MSPTSPAALCQDHGFLLAADPETGRVLHYSDNLSRWLRLPAGTAYPLHVADICDDPGAEVLRALRGVGTPTPRNLDLTVRTAARDDTVEWQCSAHRCGGMVLLDFVPWAGSEGPAQSARGWRQAVVEAMASVSAVPPDAALDDLLSVSARALQSICGFGRVLVLRFLADGSRQVLAEATGPGIAPCFRGLRLPAGDIAPQTLMMYRHNLLRVIGDVQRPAVPVRAADGVQGEPDLGCSLLRQPSALGLGLLGHLGVRAKMTFSLTRGDELWGLVTCYDAQPMGPDRGIGTFTQLACALLAQTTMAKVDAVSRRDLAQRQLALRGSLEHLVRDLADTALPPAALAEVLREIAALIGADDVGLHLRGQWLVRPRAGEDLLADLQRKVRPRGQGRPRVWCTDALGTGPAGEAGPHGTTWAGAAAVRLTRDPDGLLLLLRAECPHRSEWATGPQDLQTRAAGHAARAGAPALPAGWTRPVHGRSEPWSPWDLQATGELAAAVDELLAQRDARRLQDRMNMLASCVDRLEDMVVITDAGTDPDGPKILYVNRTYSDCTGYAPEEVLGRSPRMLQGPESDPAQREKVRRAIRDRQPCEVELINYRRDGEPYWASLNLRPLFDAAGRCTHFLGVNRLLDGNQRPERWAPQRASVDPVTGLPDRTSLLERLNGLLARRDRFGSNAALLVVNLDRFDPLNREAGRTTADELLRLCGQRLAAMTRREDIVARLGADEFAVLLASMPAGREAALASLRVIAEEMVSRLASPFELADRLWYGTAGIGAALLADLPPDEGADEMLLRARAALSHVKARGGNGWQPYDTKTPRRDLPAPADAAALHDALAGRTLELHLRLRIDPGGRPAGALASLALRHAGGLDFSPQALLDHDPGHALADSVALELLALVGGQLARGEAGQDARQSLTVRMHPELLTRPAVEQTLLAASAVWPARGLALQCEHACLAALESATLQRLTHIAKTAGLRFEVTGLGVDALPLDLLARLPVAGLVLDPAVVCEIHRRPDAQRLCKVLQGLAATLGASLVVGDVASSDEFESLSSLGVAQFGGPWVDHQHALAA